MKKEFQKGKLVYRFEDDVFFVRPLKRKYDSSFQIGSIIFDINSENKINGVEILNASKLFGASKLFLKNLISGKIIVEVNKKYLKIQIILESLVRNAQKSSILNIERVRPEFLQPTELNLAVA